MALNSSNSNAGSTEPKIGAGALSNFNTQNTENKSNGNFSGGDTNFDTSKLSINNPFDTNNSQQPTFNLDDVFTPTVSGNLDINKPSNNSSSSSSNTTYLNNSPEPTMTVDEVYGKSNNQPVVEKQGDYSVSSNEKSNVETSTFGKQDEISVTPVSVTENKGVVGNGAIQSVEGLNFQQKDKASQEVLDSKKKRDEVEAEDKADNIRNKLKNNLFSAQQQEGGEDVQIGTSEKEYLEKRNDLLQEKSDLRLTYNSAINEINNVRYDLRYGGGARLGEPDPEAENAMYIALMNELMDTAHKYGVDTSSIKPDQDRSDDIVRLINKFFMDKEKELDSALKNLDKEYLSGAETSHNDAMDAIKKSKNATPEQKALAEEAITNLEDSRKALADAAEKARSGNPADMDAYQKALEKYNKNLKEAQKIGNRFTQTDFNEDYTRAVMDAKDFNVKLSDGTEMEFSDFATEEVTKSPQYAKAMYEAKAQKYEDEKHPIRAKIERWKAKMSQTVLGSKFTFADNKVRNQFYQFVDTNMRATYATDNNILNDKTGKYSDEDKAEAFKDIEQAKALKTAATSLKYSTGALSGIGDDVNDGVFGTTDATKLTEDQRMMASIKMFTQAVLGLGISPAANKAYKDYYYLNRGDESVFENDLDNDGFTWVEEYGNSAAAGLILSAGELGVGVVLLLNPASFSNGADLIIDAVTNASNALYGVRNDVEETQKMTQDILSYFKEAEDIAESSGNEEAVQEITNAITQIENFELKADEVGNLDNWLEGSGSNTASNEKFNQSLTYDEWLKLIEADPTMREFAKSLSEKKKKDENAQKDNADARVNS